MRGRALHGALVSLLVSALSTGCYAVRPSRGGGETKTFARESLDAGDIAVLAGYRITLVARDLTFPTGITFDEAGRAYVTEAGYSYGELFTTPRLLALDGEGNRHRAIAAGDKNGPWNGVSYADGFFYVSEGGVMTGGKILRISREGEVEALLQNLPSQGDHHTNGPVVRDGWIYFAQGTVTNAGVVGPDNHEFGWLSRYPGLHDVPCQDIALVGENYRSPAVLTAGGQQQQIETGPFLPFGTRAEAGQIIRGQSLCNGAIMRIPLAGGPPELVAWGLRNPYGLAFSREGRLYATENAFDVRGSRPIFGAADVLWEIVPGTWYGWPDYAAGIPVASARYETPDYGTPRPVLARAPGTPPQPIAQLAVHSSSNGFDISHAEAFGLVGHAFIAQFGDQAPTVGKVMGPVGYKIVTVDLQSGLITDFAVNRGKKEGPASLLSSGGFERPIAARFTPDGRSLYVVDFGVLRMDSGGSHPEPGTGTVWRIDREEKRQ